MVTPTKETEQKMKAIAKQIGKSQKEQVIVDGAVFLKSVAIGNGRTL